MTSVQCSTMSTHCTYCTSPQLPAICISTLCIYISTLCTQHGYKPPYCWNTQRCRVLRQTSCRLSSWVSSTAATSVLTMDGWNQRADAPLLHCDLYSYIPPYFNTFQYLAPPTAPHHPTTRPRMCQINYQFTLTVSITWRYMTLPLSYKLFKNFQNILMNKFNKINLLIIL